MRLNVNDDYVEVWCVPSATHVQCKQRSQNNILDITAFATSFYFRLIQVIKRSQLRMVTTLL
jgi:hypothetical protein